MSYSRWGSSRWYTLRACSDDSENRDTAIFEICSVARFTAKELRSDIEKCIDTAVVEEAKRFRAPVTADDRDELREYMGEFLADVDREYPLSV